MGGFFGTISTKDCVNDLFYGTDYNSHLGTKRAGLVTFDKEKGFSRSIHSLERDYFRSKFEDELHEFAGNQGLGVISDTDPQPIIINSHLGRYAVVTVAKINNLREIADELLAQRMHLSEQSANNLNQTELVALIINMGSTFVEGINMVYRKIKGSCSMLILTEDGIIAARDVLGRTPIVIGRKEVHKISLLSLTAGGGVSLDTIQYALLSEEGEYYDTFKVLEQDTTTTVLVEQALRSEHKLNDRIFRINYGKVDPEGTFVLKARDDGKDLPYLIRFGRGGKEYFRKIDLHLENGEIDLSKGAVELKPKEQEEEGR